MNNLEKIIENKKRVKQIWTDHYKLLNDIKKEDEKIIEELKTEGWLEFNFTKKYALKLSDIPGFPCPYDIHLFRPGIEIPVFERILSLKNIFEEYKEFLSQYKLNEDYIVIGKEY